MKKVLIIGGGFAGLAALEKLSKVDLGLGITVIDQKKTFDFLPLLPDTIGRRIAPEFLAYPIEKAVNKFNARFINDQVIALDLERKELHTKTQKLNYDYLVVSSGSKTNFYGNQNFKDNAYKLDSVEDAQRLIRALNEKNLSNFVISGGGYTGIELAANLRLFLSGNKREGRILIVEKGPSILGPLPQWMKDYVSANLKRLNIEILTASSLEKTEGRRVLIAGRQPLDDALVIWAAGVKTAQFLQDLNVTKNPQGRVNVDQYLRLDDSCFVTGDAAYFSSGKGFLRMAVQFALFQGAVAGENIIRSIKGKKLHKYQPLDLGYIIPMANNRSCGTVFGINLKGFLPTMLHFVMCIYRSYGLKNKFGMIHNLITGGSHD